MKQFEEYTIKEVLAMGYKVTLEAPIVKGPCTGVHMHVSNDAIEVSKKDYWQMLGEIMQPAKASPALRKLFGVHKGIDN